MYIWLPLSPNALLVAEMYYSPANIYLVACLSHLLFCATCIYDNPLVGCSRMVDSIACRDQQWNCHPLHCHFRVLVEKSEGIWPVRRRSSPFEILSGQNYLPKVHDWVRELTEVSSIVEVFHGKWRRITEVLQDLQPRQNKGRRKSIGD